MIISLRRVMLALLTAFGLLAVTLGYWSILQRDSLISRDDNPRLVLAEQRIRRGQIVDREGGILAESRYDPQADQMIRIYHQPATASVVGYYSLRFGAGGIEAALDDVLRGDASLSPSERARQELLHLPQLGGDVQLTIDPDLQRTADMALGERRGAVVLLDIPSGDVLALVSHPTFDPNQLDQQWDSLTEDPAAPLLNRATQGSYQPGTILQSVIIGSLLNASLADPDAIVTGAPAVTIDGMLLPCAGASGNINTLRSAYLQSCPAPFQQAVGRLDAHQFRNAVDAFRLLEAPEFALPTEASPQSTDLAGLDREGPGQGNLTVNPLQMALVASAFANHGQILPLRIVQAIRAPGGVWEPVPAVGTTKGTISRESADQVADLMRTAVTNGSASGAAIQRWQVYGHAGLALAGPEGQLNAWLIGFVRANDTDHSFVIAVLVEDVAGVGPASMTARQVFEAALARLP